MHISSDKLNCGIILTIGIIVILLTTIQGTLNEHYNARREEDEADAGTLPEEEKEIAKIEGNIKVVKSQESLNGSFAKKLKNKNNNNDSFVRCNTDENKDKKETAKGIYAKESIVAKLGMHEANEHAKSYFFFFLGALNSFEK